MRRALAPWARVGDVLREQRDAQAPRHEAAAVGLRAPQRLGRVEQAQLHRRAHPFLEQQHEHARVVAPDPRARQSERHLVEGDADRVADTLLPLRIGGLDAERKARDALEIAAGQKGVHGETLGTRPFTSVVTGTSGCGVRLSSRSTRAM
jgi:hypothetical protein